MRYDEISYATRKMLADALKFALRKKTFSQITVSELVAACGINRKTFYYHFEDIFALLKWTLDDDARVLFSGLPPIVNYTDAFRFILACVEQNGYIRNCIHDAVARGGTKSFFYNDGKKVAASFIGGMETHMGLYLPSAYKDFLAAYFAESFAGIITDYIDDPDRFDRDTVIAYLSDTLELSLCEILRKKGAPQSPQKG